ALPIWWSKSRSNLTPARAKNSLWFSADPCTSCSFAPSSSGRGVMTAVAWLPLVPLTIFGGRFAGGVHVPFLQDYEVHARLLFSVPLRVLAELIVYVRIRAIAAQFIERQIITENIRPAFDAVLSSVMRLRNSVDAEIAIVVLVLLAGPFIWREALALHSDTWYATVSGSKASATPAGRWYTFISVPVFQFIL